MSMAASTYPKEKKKRHNRKRAHARRLRKMPWRDLLVAAPPPGTADDPCAGLVAMQSTRPPFDPAYASVGFALFAIVVALCVGSNVAWYFYRDEPYLAMGRSFGLNLFANVGIIAAACAYQLRLALYTESNGNSTSMSCLFTAVAAMLGVGIGCVAASLRVFVLYSRSLHARIVHRLAEEKPQDDQSQPSGGSASASSNGQGPSLLRSLAVMLFPGEWAKAGDKSATATATKTKPEGSADFADVQMANVVASGKALVFLGCIGMASLLVIIVPVVIVEPLYASARCTGCDIYLSVLVATIVMGVRLGARGELTLLRKQANALVFMSYLFLLMRHAPWDEYGVSRELCMWVVLTIGPFLAGSLLMLIDPNGLSRTNVFAWDWLCVLPSFAFVVTWDVWPVWVARNAALAHRRAADTLQLSEAQVREGIIASLSDPTFALLCERLFVAELLRFLKEEAAFAEAFFEKGESWRIARSKLIISRFIANLAPMQVNISAELRREIERAVATNDKANVDVFAKARDEAVRLLRPAYLRYLRDAQQLKKRKSKLVLAV